MCPVNTTLFVQMGSNAVLCCPAIPKTKAVLIMWVIILRDQPPCIITYEVRTKDIKAWNCTERRISWVSTPDQSLDLLISAVALSYEGMYSCNKVTPIALFQKRHDLQLPGENRTAVCEAIAGKPAVQIFWIPDGDHVTKQESHSNGTVTVRSTYHWEQNNVSTVFCFVSHPTGNQTLSIELNGRGKYLFNFYTFICLLLFIVFVHVEAREEVGGTESHDNFICDALMTLMGSLSLSEQKQIKRGLGGGRGELGSRERAKRREG
ncbi:Cell surface glycoprotein CD200 receptor 1 [Lemmus lemmus]